MKSNQTQEFIAKLIKETADGRQRWTMLGSESLDESTRHAFDIGNSIQHRHFRTVIGTDSLFLLQTRVEHLFVLALRVEKIECPEACLLDLYRIVLATYKTPIETLIDDYLKR